MYLTGVPTAAPTHANIVRVGAEYWIDNNASNDLSTHRLELGIANIILGSLVLGHAFYLKKFRFGRSRCLIDLCSLAAILNGTLVLIDLQEGSSAESNAYFCDLGVNAIIAAMAQLPDDMIFLLGYVYLHKSTSTLEWACILFYIVTLLYMSYVPQFTIAPFFLNTKSAEFKRDWVLPGLYIYTIGETLYATGFSVGFMRVLYQVNMLRTKRVQRRFQVFAFKCCLHCCSSVCASWVLNFNQSVQGLLIFNLHILASLHFLFNTNVIETMVWTPYFAPYVRKSIRNRQSALPSVGAYDSYGEAFEKSIQQSMRSVCQLEGQEAKEDDEAVRMDDYQVPPPAEDAGMKEEV